MAEQEERSPLDRLAKDPVAPPTDADAEPTDANPVPLSPTAPTHRTDEDSRSDRDPGEAGRTTAPGIVPILSGGAPGMGTAQSGIPFVAPVTRPEERKDS